MDQRDDQSNSNLRVSGYGPRIKQTLVVVIVLAAIVVAIVLAAIWANSRDPEVGVQPTPRPTQAPKPTATTPPTDTPTSVPTEPAQAQVVDTATPEPTEAPAEDTPTPTAESTKAAASETPAVSEPTPENTATATPEPEDPPTPEPTQEPTAAPADTPVPATQTPTAEPTATATEVPQPTSTPTNTPVPLPTATPTITPTPLPEVPTRLEIYARGDLIDKGIDQSGVKVLNVVEHTWPDLTLGCGPINDDNPARLVEGWILTLGNDERSYTFHIASKDQGDGPSLDEDIILNCTDVDETQQLTVNLVHELRLHEARRVILYRGLADEEQQPIEDIEDAALIQRIVDALDTPIPIGNSDLCETAFRLDFYLLRAVQTIRFFCNPEDWYRVGGEQEFWSGTQGALPQQVLDSVAPFFANQPLPAIPELPTDE